MKDKISITWSVDDVLSVKPGLTLKQAREVLRRLEDKHDATVGINWDVISDTITVLEYAGEL